MGKIKCRHCGSRIKDDYEFCPKCGARVDQQAERGGGGGGATGCIIGLFIIIILCAVGGTVWLVQEKEFGDEVKAHEKYMRDSLKALEMARVRIALEKADSTRMVADSLERREQIVGQLFRAEDFFERDGDGDVRMKGFERTQLRLRERGYSTIHRQASPEGVVMGLNAEVNGGKISGHGDVYSAAGMWIGRIELLFSDSDLIGRFLEGCRGMGFASDGELWRSCGGGGRVELRRRGELVLEIVEKK